jgi:hypothetical protein
MERRMPKQTNRMVHRHAERPQHADITLHIPNWMLNRIRRVANDCGIPCEEVIKVWVAEKVLSREKACSRHRNHGR